MEQSLHKVVVELYLLIRQHLMVVFIHQVVAQVVVVELLSHTEVLIQITEQ